MIRSRSKSERAGLLFPVSKFNARMKRRYPSVRITADASVAMSAALEYFAAEVIELAGNSCMMGKKARINNYHIYEAVTGDTEIDNSIRYVHREKHDLAGVKAKAKEKMILGDDQFLDSRSPYEFRTLSEEIIDKNMKIFEEEYREKIEEEKRNGFDCPVGGDGDQEDGEDEEYVDDYKIEKSEYEFSDEEEEQEDANGGDAEVKNVKSFEDFEEDLSDEEIDNKSSGKQQDNNDLAKQFIGELDFEESE